MKYKYARDVVMGDLIRVVADSSSGTAQLSVVEEIWHSMERGLFNPYVRVRECDVTVVMPASAVFIPFFSLHRFACSCKSPILATPVL
jgi:hypothetical protein